MSGETFILVLSLLGLLATLLLYRLGSDVRNDRRKRQRLMVKERLYWAVQQRWH